MKHWIVQVVTCIALFVALPSSAAAPNESADQLLRRAEAVRSADPKALAAALDGLDQITSGMTAAQKRQLRLLHAYQQIVTGKYEPAIKSALDVYEEAGEVNLRFRAALLIANSAAITRDFSLGLRYLETALALEGQVDDTNLRHEAYLVAAVLYNQYGQYALGEHYAEQLLSQKTSARNRCIAKHVRIESLHGLGSPLDEAEVNAAIEDCDSQNEPIPANLLRGHLARHWAEHGRLPEAVALLESHLKDVEATGYPRLIGEINGLLGEYRLRSGNLDQAEVHAHRALDKGGKDAYSLPLVTAHKVLYEAALQRGNLASALDEYRLYAEADKARLDEVKAREFAFQLSRHELQQKNQAIELLSGQNEVLRLQQEVSKKSALNNQLLVAMLLMVLGVGAYWAYKIKRVQVMFRRQAQVDSLTGVSNRGHFREEAEAQLVRSRTNAREASLVLLDLDNFKHINDRYGHATGDWVLTQVAAACRAACREGDLFGRLGGEEFAILTCGGDLHAAERVAQQCRANLAAIDTSSIEGSPSITASFGCASTKLAGHSFESLFMHADRAMYRAKAEGRDRICTHEEGPVAVRLQASA